MTLPTDICRCLGEKPTGICQQRRVCARYEQRDTYTARTPVTAWLCGPNDDDYLIHEKTQQLSA